MDVTPEVAGLAADDQADLGVGLEVLHPVNDLGSGALEFVRAVEIARLVEAGFELDEDGHVLAVFRSLDEGVDDAGFPGSPIEHLLDGDHLRVLGRLLDEAEHRLEGFVWMEKQHIAGGDGLEHRSAGRDGGRVLRGPVDIPQVVETGKERQLHERGEPRRAIEAVDLLRRGGRHEFDHTDEVARRVGAQLKPDGIREAARGEDILHFPGEVDGILLLHGDVAIPRDAEGGGGHDLFSGKELPGVDGDEVLDEDERLAVSDDGNADAPAECLGNRDERVAARLGFLIH